jgi:hypothetical protein
MSDELRERVARALCAAADDDWDGSVFYMVDANDTVESGRDVYRALADAAIALVRDAALEEAAKVCLHEIEQPFDEWSSGYKDGCEESAAAIRAMKGKP